MRQTQLMRLLVLLLALVAVATGGANAQESTRALRVAAEDTAATAHSTSGSTASGDVATSSEKSHEKKESGPATSSFTGPLIAGALAIVLIGGVVKFRQKSSASQ